jgi:hypothetical protein
MAAHQKEKCVGEGDNAAAACRGGQTGGLGEAGGMRGRARRSGWSLPGCRLSERDARDAGCGGQWRVHATAGAAGPGEERRVSRRGRR